ncbi:D-alanyl-D-alanine carboxypeptidase [Streptomyces sp. TLI_185]|uniref:D-alanyl-D-alanine carboxypeptidase n=1 Tax=Streptomyces sp. TLI_185 TaxID=2485151 RepID=UPI00288AA7BC|nr:D-alanyl-D-alanine carboxypeptidase [Streptomyces sp. TLI_185]
MAEADEPVAGAAAEGAEADEPGAEEPEGGEPGTVKAEAGKAAAEVPAPRPEAEEAAAEKPRTAEAKSGAAVAEEPAATRAGARGAAGEESGTAEAEDSDVEGAAAGGAGAADSADDAVATDAAVATKGDETGDARLRAAVAAWVRSGDSKDSEEPENAETAAEADQDAAAEPEAEAGPDADTDVEGGAAADSDEAEAEAEEGPEDAVPGTEAGADSAADASSETDVETDAESETDVDSGTDVDARTDADAGTGDEPEAGDGPGTGDGPETGGEAERGGEPVADGGPAVADGEGAPEGPPAGDDESGTGGAGGSAKAEGEAEAEDRPVDQPTAIFKRPTKLQLDHPTTMLKLGGSPKAPKTPEPSEAERTSKFVALKPLDEPRTPRQPADATAPVPQVGPERTAQQPLPPKPPLDLLAELTNTPPPPQTPVRTIIRRVKIWTPLVLLLAVVFAIVQAVRPLPTPTLALTADDSYAFDGTKAGLPWPNEGQGWMDVNGIGTMGNFGKQTPVPIGSVAKAMTAYIVLKDHPLKPGEEGKKITIDALAEKEGGYYKHNESTLNTVKKGDVLTQKQALSAIMIPSANNIARLLARWDMGSEAAFIKKMNDTAKQLGMKNTTYTDASGLKESTVSTAEDQVKLGNELVKIPALMDITKLPYWIDPSGKKWKNYNDLVPYNGAIGIKTGTTTKAGGNLLFAATKEVGGETVTVVGAILDQQTAPIIDVVNAVSKTAMLAARDALTSTKILKKGDVVGYVDDQLGGHTPIVLTKDVAAVGWAGLKVKLSFDADDVPHTAKAGTKVGTLTVGDGTSGAVKVPVALQKDLAEPGFTAKLKRLG